RPHPQSVRTGLCPRSRASGSGASRRAPPAPPSFARRTTRGRRSGARRVSREAPGSARPSVRGAELAEERVSRELAAECGRLTVPGVDDRIRDEAVEQARDRREQRLPAAALEIDAPDGAGEEEIAPEDAVNGAEGDVIDRVPRDADDLERDAGDGHRVA